VSPSFRFPQQQQQQQQQDEPRRAFVYFVTGGRWRWETLKRTVFGSGGGRGGG